MYPKVGGLDCGGCSRVREDAVKPEVVEAVIAEKAAASQQTFLAEEVEDEDSEWGSAQPPALEGSVSLSEERQK